MKYFYLFCLTPVILMLNACQSDDKTKQENAKPLFITYEVRYLEQEQELRALAYFKEGDSLDVAIPKEVSNPTFQGNAMEKQDLGEKGFRYIYTTKGPYNADMEFGYTNNRGESVKYQLNMSEFGTLSVKEGVLNKNVGATIVWDGDLVTSSQNLIFMFTSTENKATSISIQGPSEAAQAAISPGSLTQLVPGECQLYIVKKQVDKTEDQNQSITAVVEYYSSSIKVDVIE